MDLFQVKVISVQNFLQLCSFEVVNSLNVMFFVAIKRLFSGTHLPEREVQEQSDMPEREVQEQSDGNVS
ncbi:unnamed protein product [Callosobruchus maculatus]|uniref:Uncharacterized protein n=1 Tax=Callosobruchus maculatus TaxID=64391 RepID=A0A653CRI0_CALMS|nr:unnamed protein product [Callosobruchus maculatus]